MESMTAERPPVPYPAPPGDVWVAEEAGPDWQPAEAGRKCRALGPGGTAHGAPAAVRQLHGLHRRVWWQFCLQHGEGHWIEDGKVMQWVLKDEPGPQPPES